MKSSYNHLPLSPELQRELSCFLRVRNLYARIGLGFWKFIFLWIVASGAAAVIAEVIGLLSRGIH